MSLNKIKEKIEADAKADAARIRASSKKESDRIIAEAERKARAIREKADEDIELELKRIREEYQTSVALAIKDMELAAREHALSSSIDDVKAGVASKAKASKHYSALFDQAMRHARKVMPSGDLTIVTNKADSNRISASGTKHEVRDMSGGVVISSHDGTLKVNASLDKLVELNAPLIRDSMLRHMRSILTKNHATPKAQKGVTSPKRGAKAKPAAHRKASKRTSAKAKRRKKR